MLNSQIRKLRLQIKGLAQIPKFGHRTSYLLGVGRTSVDMASIFRFLFQSSLSLSDRRTPLRSSQRPSMAVRVPQS